MTDQNDVFLLLVDDHLSGCDIALERYRWILHDAHVESVLREDVIDAHPTGTVYKASVDQNGVLTLIGR